MADTKKLKKMVNYEMESMTILLTSKAEKSALTLSEFINLAKLQGASDSAIEQELLADLEEGGRLFGEFRNAIKATSNGVIKRMSDSGQYAEDLDVPTYMWVAVFVNTCPDCIERHGEIETMDEWEAQGLPGAGFTVCKEFCNCILVDSDYAILEPIKREAK